MILGDTHTEKLLATVVLIENTIRVLPQFLHMCPDEHLPELDEVAVILVVDLNDAPWVRTPANFAAIRGLDDPVGPNDRKRNLASNLLRLSDSLFVLILVCGRLINVDVMIGNVGENLNKNTIFNKNKYI